MSKSSVDIKKLVAAQMEKNAEEALQRFFFPNGIPKPTTWPPKQHRYSMFNRDWKNIT